MPSLLLKESIIQSWIAKFILILKHVLVYTS